MNKLHFVLVQGMAFDSLVGAGYPTLFSSLVQEKVVSRDIFSMCMGPSGGMLTLGGIGNYHGSHTLR